MTSVVGARCAISLRQKQLLAKITVRSASVLPSFILARFRSLLQNFTTASHYFFPRKKLFCYSVQCIPSGCTTIFTEVEVRLLSILHTTNIHIYVFSVQNKMWVFLRVLNAYIRRATSNLLNNFRKHRLFFPLKLLLHSTYSSTAA